MALALHLPSASLPPARSLARVDAHPVVLAAILDAHLRRNPTQDRVFGTLLGTRSDHDHTLHLRSAFAVPYEVRGEGQVTIDMDHHRAMVDLHHRAHPREHVVGWFASHPGLNSFSALIHHFYHTEALPHPAVHLTLDPSTLAFAAYVSAPLGINANPTAPTPAAASSDAAAAPTPAPAPTPGAHLAFLPVDTTLSLPAQERPGLDLLTRQLLTTSTTTTSSSPAALSAPQDATLPESALSTLSALLARVSDMLDAVLEYVDAVASGQRTGDDKIGRALLETIGQIPGAAARSTPEDESSAAAAPAPGAAAPAEDTAVAAPKDFEEEFNAHLADVLMVNYLANLIKTQAELASRLNLVL